MSKLSELYEAYSNERQHNLSQEEFAAMLRMIPGLLVAASDGVMDTKEWVLVDKMSKMMGDELIPDTVENAPQKEEILMNNIKEEIRFIMKSVSEWKEQILDALKENIEGNAKLQDFVGQAMYLFAGTSSGLSYDEEQKIDELYERLGL